MRRVVHPILALWLGSAIGSVIGTPLLQADDHDIYVDPQGDALVRRTDLGNAGPINVSSLLPDLWRIEIGGWESPNPAANPFKGQWDDAEDTGLFRVNLVFDGLINPPGPIGLDGPEYDPYRYGPSPVYGFVEFDVDEQIDTGGEIANIENRFLGNVARFGGQVEGDLGERAAVSAEDFDGDLLSLPLVERSGSEWHLSLCGCDPISVVTTFDDPSPNSFDAGDTWVIAARFVHRTHAFSEYAFVFGGSGAGEYDPQTLLMFAHQIGTDTTTVSLVYAMDQEGAGLLAGRPEESIDLNAGNQTSIHEMVSEIRFAALNSFDPGIGSTFDLLREWNDEDHDDLEDYLEPESWSINAIFGTAYLEQQDDATYVWTDVAFDFVPGDMTGDGSGDEDDQDWISGYISLNDGGSNDADGMVNGQVGIPFFGLNFFLGDLNYDGAVNALDFGLISRVRSGDVNGDLSVDGRDLFLLNQLRGLRQGDPGFNAVADLNHNGLIDKRDAHFLRKILRLSTQSSGN